MGQREIARYYTLSDDDLKRIRRHRRDHNRLGYAVQLGLLRYPGWPFRPAESVPVPMITYIAAQLRVGPKLIKEYSTTRDTTRREHLAHERSCAYRLVDRRLTRRRRNTGAHHPKPFVSQGSSDLRCESSTDRISWAWDTDVFCSSRMARRVLVFQADGQKASDLRCGGRNNPAQGAVDRACVLKEK